MKTFNPYLAILPAIFMFLALFIFFLNAAIAYRNFQNRKQGIKKTVSFIPLLAILCSLIAYMFGRPVFGRWPLLLIALDPLFWNIIGLPWYLITRYRKGKKASVTEVNSHVQKH